MEKVDERAIGEALLWDINANSQGVEALLTWHV